MNPNTSVVSKTLSTFILIEMTIGWELLTRVVQATDKSRGYR